VRLKPVEKVRYQQQPKDENAYTAKARGPAQFMEFISPSRTVESMERSER
jgi:hypothetical protein